MLKPYQIMTSRFWALLINCITQKRSIIQISSHLLCIPDLSNVRQQLGTHNFIMSKTAVKRKHPNKVDEEEDAGLGDIPDDEELKYLEKIVLGTGSDVFKDKSSDEDSDEESDKETYKEEKKPAWVDEEDDVTFDEVVKKQGRRCTPGAIGSKDYQTIMKQKYQQVMGVPKWAKRPKKSGDPAEDLLNTCGNFIKKPKHLGKGLLEFKKLKNLNFETRTEGPFINILKFHPKSTVAMVAGVSGVVSLFQVDGKQNTKLQSLQFKQYPIYCGSFLKNGEEFIIGSQYKRFFYCHNLMTGKSMKVDNSKLIDITKTKKFCVSPKDDFIAVCGNTGKIYLFTVSTKEYVDCLQMNSNVTALDFNQDGSILYSHGEDGEVYIWDMKSRTCIKKFYDDGCLTGTSIAVSNNNQFIACGSSSGVVNIYDRESVHSGNGTLPTKTIYNLVTPVTSVRFNASSEVLAIASKDKENAVKLVHCPSMTVFSNFPQFQSKIMKPFCMDFSPNGGFFGIGDNKGSAHLFRLKYYGNY